MKIYVPPPVSKGAKKSDISDDRLRGAVVRAEKGQIDARLGPYLIKQRIAREGRGRSGGFRTIIAHMVGDSAVFLHLFAKNEKANLTKAELEAFKDYSERLAEHSEQDFFRLITERGWRQIDYEEPEEDVPK